MKTFLSALVAGVVAAVAVTACGGSENSATSPETSVGCIVGAVSVSPATATLHPGDSLRVVFTYTPCFGSPTTTAQWRSSNASVATVGVSDGLVRAYSRGQATIIAADSRDPSVQGAMLLVVE